MDRAVDEKSSFTSFMNPLRQYPLGRPPKGAFIRTLCCAGTASDQCSRVSYQSNYVVDLTNEIKTFPQNMTHTYSFSAIALKARYRWPLQDRYICQQSPIERIELPHDSQAALEGTSWIDELN